MDFTNFPDGFPNGVTIRGLPVLNTYGGNIFYVDSTSPNKAAGGPGTIEAPFDTIDHAMSACVANNGDLILVQPGHTETVTAAGGITADVAGVSIIGLGSGAERPRITFSTATTASFLISAKSVTVENIVGIPALNAIANPFNVTGNDAYLNVEIQDASNSIECVRGILATGVSRLYAALTYLGSTGGSSCVNGIRLVNVSGATIQANMYGKASTAWVEMITTASTDVQVYGYMYNSGTTDGSKDVVDTVGGSTWYGYVNDGSAGEPYSGGSGKAWAPVSSSATIIADLDVPTADSTDNVLERDVIGNKTDAAVGTVGTTSSIIAYIKGLVSGLGTLVNTGGVATLGAMLGDFANTTLISKLNIPTANSTNNVSVADVGGNKTDSSVYVPTDTASNIAYSKGSADLQENTAFKAAATMTNGQTIFTVAGGPIEIIALASVCVTTNDATGSTVQYSVSPTSGAVQTISAASGSIANATPGGSITLQGTSLSTAALYNSNGPNLIANPGTIFCPAGTITIVVGVGSTTGTWAHYLRYRPLAKGVTVS